MQILGVYTLGRCSLCNYFSRSSWWLSISFGLGVYRLTCQNLVSGLGISCKQEGQSLLNLCAQLHVTILLVHLLMVPFLVNDIICYSFHWCQDILHCHFRLKKLTWGKIRDYTTEKENHSTFSKPIGNV